MGQTNSTRTKPSFFPDAAVLKLKASIVQFSGLVLCIFSLIIFVALVSYNTSDPSLNTASSNPPKNLVGFFGSHLSDILLQAFGVIGYLIPLTLAIWGVLLYIRNKLSVFWARFFALLFGIVFLCSAATYIETPEFWPLQTGLGGVFGDVVSFFVEPISQIIGGSYIFYIFTLVFLFLGLLSLGFATCLTKTDWRNILFFIFKSLKVFLNGFLLIGKLSKQTKERLYPSFDPDNIINSNVDSETHPNSSANNTGDTSRNKAVFKEKIVEKKREKIKKGTNIKTADQGLLAFGNNLAYTLPPLDILTSSPVPDTDPTRTAKALSQNARVLEKVLADFGVSGEVVKVRPGPVVTLYELEPAPGTKTSRVISLADDIARSMSALSVRIAVVPGKSVIGIELPNLQRDAVCFRELISSESLEKFKGSLNLALGKDIGGIPKIVDLASMPHLLIAGTTGSGKSVAINTMICSLLYKLTPDICKFIMIDPKMLELSVYDGIPNLLTPVVTEPAKAVFALKWAVREMENRYRLMSQLGVRNISGYNARIAQATKKGEELTKRIQTGFDESGKPILEDQPLSMETLPLIVIVVDEMADLMIIAGKDIEAAIQRLAQMARAAGIHLIMATQRPSVDVITGTIKANFPTRISFQVTSKVDSRTILGEQGAEQLLGQGDMLYMAGGGQIARVHGPLIRDEEVEAIATFLRKQGSPDYVEEVTAEVDESSKLYGGGVSGSADSCYDDAVALVAREGKASTSFIQRHLQIGYNRAARIMDQMEEQGIVTKADRVGRREVLIEKR